MNLPGKNVAILGLGQSGYDTALFLKEKGLSVFVSESSETDRARQLADDLKRSGIDVEIGGHTLNRILEVDWVMPSPGIPPHSEILKSLKSARVCCLSEIEVASLFCPTSKIVAITGSAGKTTCATLIARALKKQFGENNVVLCGNIGTPWISQLKKLTEESWVVLEVSSFQLAFCKQFRPFVAILTNLYPNHLDWHKDMEDYVVSKLNIFQAQSSAEHAFFQKSDQSKYFSNFIFNSKTHPFVFSKTENTNQEILFKVGSFLGCNSECLEKVWSSFEGIEHRLESLGAVAGVEYINDSKSTTVASLKWALEQRGDKEVVLIAGGKPKSNDFDQATELIGLKVKTAILIGEASKKLESVWKPYADCQCVSSLELAFEFARESAVKGDVVLFSPACASFDMFKDYIDRGNQFKKLFLEASRQSPSEVDGEHVV